MRSQKKIPILAALGCIGLLFATIPAFADMGIYYSVILLRKTAIIAPILVTVIEIVIIRFFADIDWLKALWCSLCINIASFIAGFIYFPFEDGEYYVPEMLIIVILGLILLYAHARQLKQKGLAITGGLALIIAGLLQYFLDIDGWWIDFSLGFQWDIGMFAIFALCFGCTLAIEVWVARLFISRDHIEKTILWANVASYIAMFFILLFVSGYEYISPVARY